MLLIEINHRIKKVRLEWAQIAYFLKPIGIF